MIWRINTPIELKVGTIVCRNKATFVYDDPILSNDEGDGRRVAVSYKAIVTSENEMEHDSLAKGVLFIYEGSNGKDMIRKLRVEERKFV